MKSKPIIGLIIYAVVPAFVIYILFRLNTFAGIFGIVAYFALIFMMNRIPIFRLRAQIEYNKGNYENAAKLFEKAVNSKNAGIDVYVQYGFVLLKSGRLAEAEKILSHALDKSRNNDEKNLAKSNLALAIWKKGDLDTAYTMLTEVISEYKTTAAYGSIGYMAIEKGDLDEALKINLEAWEYNPENAIIQDNMAHLYHLRGDMEKAGEIFKKLVEKEPHFPEAYYDYGRYLEDMNKNDEAAEMYRKALSRTFSFNSTITREQVQQRLSDLEGKAPVTTGDSER